MIKDAVLSSEQALDEYFTALLGEEMLPEPEQETQADEGTTAEIAAAEEAPAQEAVVAEPEAGSGIVEEVEAEVKVSAEDMMPEAGFSSEPQLQPQADFSPSYNETVYNEFEVPDLEDVQRLLSQLENSSFADTDEIDQLLEQNTADIAAAVAEPEVAEPETVTETVTEAVEEVAEPEVELAVEEEVQEWDVEAFAEPAVEEPVIEAQPEVADAEPVAETETEVEPETQAGEDLGQEWQNVARNEAFQVLYFDVNSVTFAVPLDELGGIHRKADELNHLIGRPDWYLGLQTNKTDQLDVVDTARWAMAEKLADNDHRDKYQYVVMLGESHWGLASDQLKGTEWLDPEKIRWRQSPGKRPWLAGMVKEKMCALIHVNAMVKMLNAGLDVKALDN